MFLVTPIPFCVVTKISCVVPFAGASNIGDRSLLLPSINDLKPSTRTDDHFKIKTSIKLCGDQPLSPSIHTAHDFSTLGARPGVRSAAFFLPRFSSVGLWGCLSMAQRLDRPARLSCTGGDCSVLSGGCWFGVRGGPSLRSISMIVSPP